MKRLTLCADDFGHSPGTSAVIAELIRAGRINATCCMALTPSWPSDWAMLRGVVDRAEIGIHLTLTDERPLTAMPRFAPDGAMPRIDQLARQRDFPVDEIAAEIAAQFARFTAVAGRPPDFVDGHQHVHHLRGIRDIVLAETRRSAPRAWLRDCGDTLPGMLARPFVLKAIGSAWRGRGFRAAAHRAGLATNDGFAGHYDFGEGYAELFPAFLRRPGSHHLVMVHPGTDDTPGDSIGKARVREAAFLHRSDTAALAGAEGLRLSCP